MKIYLKTFWLLITFRMKSNVYPKWYDKLMGVILWYNLIIFIYAIIKIISEL